MTVHLILFTDSEPIRHQVADFARGLGCTVSAAPASPDHGLRAELPDEGEALLELLSHVALTATKAGVDLSEPLCRVVYKHQPTAPEVAVGFRLTEFNINTGPRT
jgi:hypothetical protein